jgi:hypothetical protein
MPDEIAVDGDWYLAQYGDVHEAVNTGEIETARDYFCVACLEEGRLPAPGFTFKLV